MIRIPGQFHLKLLVFAWLAAYSCSSENDKKSSADHEKGKYVAYAKTSEQVIQKTKEVRDIIFEVNEIPAEFRALRFVKNKESAAFRDELSAQQEISVYKIRIKTHDGSNIWEHENLNVLNQTQKQQYFSLRFQENIALNVDDSTIVCSMYSLDQLQNSKPYIDIVAGFKLPVNQSENRIIIINDQYFGLGKIKIKVNS